MQTRLPEHRQNSDRAPVTTHCSPTLPASAQSAFLRGPRLLSFARSVLPWLPRKGSTELPRFDVLNYFCVISSFIFICFIFHNLIFAVPLQELDGTKLQSPFLGELLVPVGLALLKIG